MRIVVIGNGIAGNSVADKIREHDIKSNISIISKEDVCSYSACVLANYLSGEIDRERVFVKKKVDYYINSINTVFGKEAIKIYPKERRVLLCNNKELLYDKLVLATGSIPFLPKIKGSEKLGVFQFKTLSDIEQIISLDPKKVIVVGSGPIGIEASLALKKRDCDVYLVEAMEWIMPKLFDKEPSEIFKNIMEKNGINIRTGEKLLEIIGNHKVKAVKTNKDLLPCDSVILAMGMKPNIELATNSGIKIGEMGGIKTDNFLKTSEDGIYACGDCIEINSLHSNEKCLNMLWLNAKCQGSIAGLNVLGKKRRYYGSENIMSINIFENYGLAVGKTKTSLEKYEGLEIKEKAKGDRYLKNIILGDKIVGVQAINEPNLIGTFVGLQRSQKNIQNILTGNINYKEYISKYTLIHKNISYMTQ